MARSLTVQPEETATTSALLNGFLLLAVLFLAFGMIASMSAEADATATEAAVAQ